jgi:hypothetical protein
MWANQMFGPGTMLVMCALMVVLPTANSTNSSAANDAEAKRRATMAHLHKTKTTDDYFK